MLTKRQATAPDLENLEKFQPRNSDRFCEQLATVRTKYAHPQEQITALDALTEKKKLDYIYYYDSNALLSFLGQVRQFPKVVQLKIYQEWLLSRIHVLPLVKLTTKDEVALQSLQIIKTFEPSVIIDLFKMDGFTKLSFPVKTSILTMIEELQKEDRAKILNKKNIANRTLLHIAAIEQDIPVFNRILRMIEKLGVTDRSQILQFKDNQQTTAIQYLRETCQDKPTAQFNALRGASTNTWKIFYQQTNPSFSTRLSFIKNAFSSGSFSLAFFLLFKI